MKKKPWKGKKKGGTERIGKGGEKYRWSLEWVYEEGNTTSFEEKILGGTQGVNCPHSREPSITKRKKIQGV